MKLITVENDKKGILTTPLTQVNVEDAKALQKAVKNLDKMVKVLEEHSGLGLTANQVGLTDAMFVFQLKDGSIEYVINPEIVARTGGYKTEKEGCLSYPEVGHVDVRRSKEIIMNYHNGTSYVIKRKFKGLEARICQHEEAHVKGLCALIK